MKDHDGDVLSIGGNEPTKPAIASARAGAGERMFVERDVSATIEELRRLNADLERQNRVLRREQLELAASRDRYWDLWAHAPVGCLTLDRDGCVLDANLAATMMLGAARPRLLGRALAEWTDDHDAEALFRLRRTAVTQARVARCSVRLVGPDGDAFRATVRSVAVRGEHGRTEWLVVLTTDEATR